jgi:hypothetical protein
MSISKVADRIRQLQLAADNVPPDRWTLENRSARNEAAAELEAEADHLADPWEPVESPPDDTNALRNAHSRLKDALCSVGGALFESQAYYAVHRVSGAYRACIEFNGWQPHLIVGDTQMPIAVVVYPRAAFRYEFGPAPLEDVVSEALAAINAMSFHDPETLVCNCYTETEYADSYVRYWSVDVEGIGTLVRRYRSIGQGPWLPIDYPGSYRHTLVIPHQQGMDASCDASSPNKE